MDAAGRDRAPDGSPAGAIGRAELPLVVFDGACGLCTEQVARLARLTKGRLRFESFREPGFFERHPELKPEACDLALQLVVRKKDGSLRVHSGAGAVVRAASRRWWLRLLLLPYWLPPVKMAADAAYRWIARNRFLLSKGCGKDGCPTHVQGPSGGGTAS